MISLFEYVSKYGNFSFQEEKFNDVDNVILSLLSYINFKGIVSGNREGITLKDAAQKFFSVYSKKDLNNNIISIKSAIKLFSFIKDYKRYQDLILYNYVYSENVAKQFSAISIRVLDELVYVSFEGTDELIGGWKEDLELAYMFPIPSQIDAINYLNRSIRFKDKKVIVGGHSKGGNLALVASMYANILIRKKIIKIYSNDGPGLLEEELNSYRLRRIKNKYIHIIPEYSIVGMLLGNCNNEVIKSKVSGILAHDALNWEVEDNHFISTKIDDNSYRFSLIMEKWLKDYTFEQRMILVEELFQICEKNNIYSLLDIKSKGFFGIIGLIKDSRNLDLATKEMFKSLVSLIVDDTSKTIKEKINFTKDKKLEEDNYE